ncbi:MAG: hypothetical protein ACREFQ_13715, partial [Stellaceae bacterium]
MAIALTSNASDFVSSGETAACTLATIHAGDIVVVHAMVQYGTATGISDSAGVLTFGAARASVLSGSTTLYEYVAKASAAASGDTITLSTSATDTIWICASAWSGLASSGWFDPNGSLPATSGSGAA